MNKATVGLLCFIAGMVVMLFISALSNQNTTQTVSPSMVECRCPQMLDTEDLMDLNERTVILELKVERIDKDLYLLWEASQK